MEIENMLKKLPRFSATPIFKDQLHDRLITEMGEREQPRWRFGWKLAWAVVSFVIVFGFGSIFLKNYFGRDFLRSSTVMAAEIVKKSLESFFRKESIYHQITKQFLEDKTEPIVYELWEDNDTPRFLNHVTYPASVYPPDGQESWQGFFIETKESYWWEVDINEKIVRQENYIYSSEEDRWQKLDARVDVPRFFNDLIEKGILETKEGRLDKREVYVVYDTRTDPDKYWDILTFDKNTFQLLRTEKYVGEGDNRKLSSLVEYELQESIPATPDNIDKYFKSYPIETKDFKYLQRDFYVNDGGAKEDFKEITAGTSSETANWKTITNFDWNYEIKVPNEWKQIIQSARFNNHLGFNAGDGSHLDISVNKLNTNSLEQYLEIIDKEDKDQVKILETKIITPNMMIERKEEMLEAGMNQLVFYTVRNNYVVRLSLIPADGDISKIGSNEVYKYYNQILSTFKFTDGDSSITQTGHRKVQLFYYNKNLDPKFNCISEAVVSVNREILMTKTPIQDTIKLLIEGKLTEKEKAGGFSTEFPYPGFKLLGANLKDGILTLDFPEMPSFTTGGSCRVGILRAEIEKTAKQFPEVKKVEYTKDGMFQP